MPILCLPIRFLDDRYHGRTDRGRSVEWPPSPLRLFQALVAGNCGSSSWCDRTHGEALRWLVRQRPPTIHCPDGVEGAPCMWYVRNNSDDGQHSKAEKHCRPTLLCGGNSIHYVWSVDPGDWHDGRHAEQLQSMMRTLRALGWGMDFVVGSGRIGPAPASVQVWEAVRPSFDPLDSLPVPSEHTLRRLQSKYAEAEHEPKHLDTEAFRAERFHYRQRGTRSFCAFRFVRDEDDPAVYGLRHIKQLAGQLRHVAADVAKDQVDPTLIDGMILGHPKDGPRLSIVPLPSIGHPHSDGLIRRVLLAEPFGSDGVLCARLARGLQGKTVEFEGACSCRSSELDAISHGDSVLRRYTTEANTWASVTPVLLPGHNERRQQRRDHARSIARAQALLCKSLHQAGLRTPAQIEIDQVPYWPGSLHARDYDPRDKLAHLPRYHCRIVFDSPVAGPLSIGAGRHVGFGVLAACDQS